MNPLCLGVELMLLGARVCLGDAAKPPPMAEIVCPTLEDWPAAEQRALAAEMRAHPGLATTAAVKKLARIRAQVRACLKAQKK
jgi:hypothetical protein